MALMKINSYTKNVAKSFGYALQDMVGDYAPNISSMLKETKETSKEVYSAIRDWHNDNRGSIDERQLKGGISGAANQIWKNLVDDMKTGNWYNKSRQEALNNNLMAGFMGDDFSFDDLDFDSDDWGDDDDDDGFDEQDTAKATVKAVKSETARSTLQLSQKMDQVGYSVSKAVNQGQVASANYIVEANNANSRAIYRLTESGFGTVTKALMSVNNSINGFAQLGQPLTVHMQNSSVFYTNTTEQLNKINESLQKLVANTTIAEPGGKKGKGSGYEMLFTDGRLDINAWKEMIKENFANDKDMMQMAMNMIKGLDPKNISIGTLMTRGMTHMLFPKILKDSMKNLDETVKYAVHDLFFKGKNKLEGTGFLGSILSQYIFPDTTAKNGMNTANYEKGKVAWDGIARRALTYVIPVYLSKIYSAISGAEETIYNYDSGKFMKMRMVKGMKKLRDQRYVEQAGGDFRKDVHAKLSRVDVFQGKALSEADKQKILKDIDRYIQDCMESDGDIDFNDYYTNLKNAKYRDFHNVELIRYLFDGVKAQYQRAGVGYKARSMNYQISQARVGRNNELSSMETSGHNVEAILYDGTFDPDKKYKPGATYSIRDLFMPDKHKNTLMDYMFGIYTILSQGGGSGRGRRGRGPKGPSGPIDPAKYDEFLRQYEEEEYKEEKKAQKTYIGADGKEYTYDTTGAIDYSKGLIGKWLEKHGLGGLANASPFTALAGMVNTMSQTITEVVWGKDGEPDKGLFGNFKAKMDDFFESLKKKFDNVWDKWAKKLFGEKDEEGNRSGGILSGFINDTRSNLKGAGRWAKNAFREVWRGKANNDQYNQFLEMGYDPETAAASAKAVARHERRGKGKTRPENGNAANGRRVTKTGMVAVSEGELIVPAELNPFYNKPVNKMKQYRDEAKAVKDYYGSYADGGDPFGSGLGGLLKMALGKSKEKLTETFSRIFGDAKDAAKSEKIMNETMRTVFGEAKQNAGAMGAGALIGGGVSLLTGAMVGPLFGAAIGAGVGLTIKSEKVQKLLFGDIDENGDREGGLFNQELSNFLTKNAPEMAKGALVGGAAGLFMGSPFLGMMIGAGVKYISSSERAKEFLFGSKTEDTGVISKEVQEKIKERMPGITTGAIAGLVAGPFGIAGNLIFGAGLGYLASSEEFKDKLFGEKDEDGKRHGGMLGTLREKIVNPLSELAVNTTRRVGDWLTRTGKRLTTMLFGAGKKLFGLASKLIGKMFAGTAIGKAFTAIGKGIFGKAADFIKNRAVSSKAKNAAAGVSIYDAKAGRNLRASEVLEMINDEDNASVGAIRKAKKNTAQMNIYQALAGIENEEQLNQFKKASKYLDSAKYSGRQLTDKQLELISKTKGFEGLVQNGQLDMKALKKINTNSLRDLANNEKARLNTPENEVKTFHVDVRKQLGFIGKVVYAIGSKIGGKGFKDSFKNANVGRGETTDITDTIKDAVNTVDNAGEGPGEGMADGGTAGNNESRGFMRALLAQTKAIYQKLVLGTVDENTMKAAGGGSTSGNETHTEMTAFGDQVEINPDGSPDLSSTQTKRAFSFKEKFAKGMDHLSHLPIIGSAISGISGLLGLLKDKLIGDDKKKGLLGIIGDLLSGAMQGPLSMLTKLFLGEGSIIGPIAKSLGQAVSMKTIFPIAGGLLVTAALTGAFDDFWETLSAHLPGWLKKDGTQEGKDNTKNISKETYDGYTEDGRFIEKAHLLLDENNKRNSKTVNGKTYYETSHGEWIDIKGKLKDEDTSMTVGSNTSLSHQLWENLIRGLLKGKPSIASAAIGKGLKTVGKGVAPIVRGGIRLAAKGASALQGLKAGAKIGYSGLKAGGRAVKNLLTNNADEGLSLIERITRIGANSIGEQAGKNAGREATDRVLKFVGSNSDDIVERLVKGGMTQEAAERLAAKVASDPEAAEKLMKITVNRVTGETAEQAAKGVSKSKGLFAGIKKLGQTFFGEAAEGAAGEYAEQAGKNAYKAMFEKATKGGMTKEAAERFATKAAKTATENAAEKTVGKSGFKLVQEASSEAAEAALKNNVVVNAISGALDKLQSVLLKTKIPLLTNFADNISAIKDAIIPKLMSHADDIASDAGKAASKGSKLASLFAIGPIDIAIAAADAVNAWGDAASILGIVEKSDKNDGGFGFDIPAGYRAVAAVVAAINSLIPIIGGFIPNSVIINVLIDIGKKIGIDLSNIEDLRQQSADYAKERNSSVEQINDENGKTGLYKKIANSAVGKAVKKTASAAWEGIKSAGRGFGNFIKTTKEKGIGAALSEAGSAAWQGLKNAGTAVGGLALKGIQKLDDVFGIKDLLGFVKSGDLMGFIKYEPNTVNEDDNQMMRLVKQIPAAIVKYALYPEALISFAGHKVVEVGKKIIEKVKGGFKYIKEQVEYGANFFNKDQDEPFSQYMSVKDPDPQNPIGGLAKAAVVGMRLVGAGSVVVKFIGKKIGDAFGNLVNKVKDGWDSLVGHSKALGGMVLNGEPLELLKYSTIFDKENPVGPIMGGILGAEKQILFIPSAISWVGHKIYDLFQTVKEPIAKGWNELMEHSGNLWEHTKNGEPLDLIKYGTVFDQDNPVGPIMGGILDAEKQVLLIPSAISWVGHRIYDGFKWVSDKVSKMMETINKVNETIDETSKTGTLIDLWKIDTSTDEEGNPLGFLGGLSGFVSKAMHTPGVLIRNIGEGITYIFDKMHDNFKSDQKSLDDAKTSMEDLAKDGEVTKILTYKKPAFKSLLFSKFFGFGFRISQVMNLVTASFHKMLGPIDDLLGGLKDIINTEEQKHEGDSGTTHTGQGGAFGSGMYSGGSSGVVNQFDYPNGANACGPAAASMVAQAYGKNYSMNNAISDAKPYQMTGGTEISYFDNALGKQGIHTRNIDRSQVMSSLANGQQVILAGQDASNTSKANSPFGPRPHYVVASGTTGGKILIKDSETGRITPYDQSILNNVQRSVAAGSGISAKRGRYVAGGGLDSGTDENISQIWGYLKSKGLTDLGAAGLMGCWGVESHNNSDVLEGNYYFKADQNAVMANNATMNDYTNQLFAFYDRNGVSYNKSAYVGSDGNYYPGYGIAQWTGPRQEKYIKWAQQNGKDHRNLATQLDYVYHEYQNRPALQSALANAQTVQDGTIGALDHFEMYDGWHAKKRGQKQLNQRIPHAENVLSKMGGTMGTAPANKIVKPGMLATNAPVGAYTDTGGYQVYDDKVKRVSSDEIKDYTYTDGGIRQDSGITESSTLPGSLTSTSGTTSNFGITTHTGESGTTHGGIGGKIGSSSSSSSGGEEKLTFGNILSKIIGAFSDFFNGTQNKNNDGNNVTGPDGEVVGPEGMTGSSDWKYSEDNNNGSPASQGSLGDGTILSKSGGYVNGEVANDFPYYNQGDQPWGPIMYGPKTIAKSGCGPTSMAMVMKSYGTNVTPQDTAAWSVAHGHRTESNGTGWGFFDAIGKEAGLETTQFTNLDMAKEMLANKIPVIGSMKPGEFTKGGHFIVFTGLKNNGAGVVVNDPNSREKTKTVYDTDYAMKQAKQFWAITKDGKGSLGQFGDHAVHEEISKDNKTKTVTQGNQKTVMTAQGSGLPYYSAPAKVLAYHAQSKRSKPANTYTGSGSNLSSLHGYYVAGGSGLATMMTDSGASFMDTPSSVAPTVNLPSGSTVDANTLKILFESIANILKNVADNTIPVRQILEVLQAYLPNASHLSEEDVSNIANHAALNVAANVTNKEETTDVSSHFKSFIAQLGDMAKG